MDFPQIRMESKFAKIQVSTTPAEMNPKLEKVSLSIEQAKAEMNFITTKGKLTIDQSQAWEERQLMSTLRLNDIHANEGMQAISEGTARRAEQGAQLMKIENGANAIVEQAVENGHRHMKQLSIKYVPSPFAVKMHYEKGSVDTNIETKKPEIDVKLHEVDGNYTAGKVHVDMEQFAELNIEFINLYR